MLRGRAEYHCERWDSLAVDLRCRAEREDGRDLSRDFPRQRSWSSAEVRQTIDRRSAGACTQLFALALQLDQTNGLIRKKFYKLNNLHQNKILIQIILNTNIIKSNIRLLSVIFYLTHSIEWIVRVYSICVHRFWTYTIAPWDYLESAHLTTIPCVAWISGWRNPTSSSCNTCPRHRKWSNHISYRK